jgi:hypothetical protein
MNADSTTVRNLRGRPQLAVMFEPEAEIYLYGTVELIADHATKRRIADTGLFPFSVEGFFGPPEHDSWVLVRLAPARATLISQGETFSAETHGGRRRHSGPCDPRGGPLDSRCRWAPNHGPKAPPS